MLTPESGFCSHIHGVGEGQLEQGGGGGQS